ncbi:unnamed protein product [Caenorhabditis bovis]|uniref:Beta-1,4-mannosyltransferase n=1 Tax=Caenorhabditis bovis TaxID=2654633 RepID=A0A8S1EVW2_9PELO|nr:unnamed protein product [Caenorhabditis bovis]
MNYDKKCEAAVVVVGDVGRSPRMCNHAKMLADEGFLVKIFGFCDSLPGKAIKDHPNIRISPILPPPELAFLPVFVQLPIKLVWNFVFLTFALLFKTSFSNLRVVLMQNPPALPTMPVCFLIAKLKNAKFCIDWHNYMFSILRDKYDLTEAQITGEGNNGNSMKIRIVRIVRYLEGICGRLSDRNLCVTNAMRNDLKQHWGIEANTFYDRPPSWKFSEPTIEEIHELYQRLQEKEDGAVLKNDLIDESETLITQKLENGTIIKREHRPLVLLSSTSWTADEKFEILLDALFEYDKIAADRSQNFPRLFVIITGKGPLKRMYMEQIDKKQLKFVNIYTPWLEAEDYPKMIASADLGISLHTSTSGLDLPMKVVDMFGAKVPVLAKKFRCIAELVKEGDNGYLFENSDQLLEKLKLIAKGFPTNLKLLNLKENVVKNKFETWEEMWNREVKDILQLPSEFDNRRQIQKLKSIYIVAIGILSIFVFGIIYVILLRMGKFI